MEAPVLLLLLLLTQVMAAAEVAHQRLTSSAGSPTSGCLLSRLLMQQLVRSPSRCWAWVECQSLVPPLPALEPLPAAVLCVPAACQTAFAAGVLQQQQDETALDLDSEQQSDLVKTQTAAAAAAAVVVAAAAAVAAVWMPDEGLRRVASQETVVHLYTRINSILCHQNYDHRQTSALCRHQHHASIRQTLTVAQQSMKPHSSPDLSNGPTL
jgi:hypothetical protein